MGPIDYDGLFNLYLFIYYIFKLLQSERTAPQDGKDKDKRSCEETQQKEKERKTDEKRDGKKRPAEKKQAKRKQHSRKPRQQPTSASVTVNNKY